MNFHIYDKNVCRSIATHPLNGTWGYDIEVYIDHGQDLLQQEQGCFHWIINWYLALCCTDACRVFHGYIKWPVVSGATQSVWLFFFLTQSFPSVICPIIIEVQLFEAIVACSGVIVAAVRFKLSVARQISNSLKYVSAYVYVILDERERERERCECENWTLVLPDYSLLVSVKDYELVRSV